MKWEALTRNFHGWPEKPWTKRLGSERHCPCHGSSTSWPCLPMSDQCCLATSQTVRQPFWSTAKSRCANGGESLYFVVVLIVSRNELLSLLRGRPRESACFGSRPTTNNLSYTASARSTVYFMSTKSSLETAKRLDVNHPMPPTEVGIRHDFSPGPTALSQVAGW